MSLCEEILNILLRKRIANGLFHSNGICCVAKVFESHLILWVFRMKFKTRNISTEYCVYRRERVDMAYFLCWQSHLPLFSHPPALRSPKTGARKISIGIVIKYIIFMLWVFIALADRSQCISTIRHSGLRRLYLSITSDSVGNYVICGDVKWVMSWHLWYIVTNSARCASPLPSPSKLIAIDTRCRHIEADERRGNRVTRCNIFILRSSRGE